MTHNATEHGTFYGTTLPTVKTYRLTLHTFLQLIDKHFSPTNKLDKLFNLHTVRVSCSCSKNMKSFISRHNKPILRRHDQKTETTNTNYTRNSNCRRTERCPTQGNCLQVNVIYKTDVTTTNNNETKTYIRSNSEQL